MQRLSRFPRDQFAEVVAGAVLELRKTFVWGRARTTDSATPFKVGTESVIALDPETPGERRFACDDGETRLLQGAARSRTPGENRVGPLIHPILPRNEVSENPGTLQAAYPRPHAAVAPLPAPPSCCELFPFVVSA